MLRKMIDAVRRAFTAQPHLFVVLTSGILGGLLAVSVQALFRTGGDLTVFAVPRIGLFYYLLFGIFGALAAGFSVYLAANSRRDDLVHLSFFALSCGIAFPAVLLETTSKAAREAQETIKSAATVVTDTKQPISEVAPAAAALAAEAVAQAPAGEVDRQTRAIVADQTSTLIEKLNQESSPEAAAAAQTVFDAATQAGYENIAAPASVTAPPASPTPATDPAADASPGNSG